tara:strand:+ start:53 stop:205 length:153 start_codon:yes stop_codon:yes gene_type:complete
MSNEKDTKYNVYKNYELIATMTQKEFSKLLRDNGDLKFSKSKESKKIFLY